MNRERRIHLRRVMNKMDFHVTKDQIRDLIDTCDRLESELEHVRGKFTEQVLENARLQDITEKAPVIHGAQ